MSNFVEYKAARIPYSRNHDSAVCGIYGGPYSHDVTCVFPDFDADVDAPESYDFLLTIYSLDKSILSLFFRLFKNFFTIHHFRPFFQSHNRIVRLHKPLYFLL